MATAAAVPSRARAAKSPPPPGTATDVSYVRLTLAVDAVHGAPAGSYFARWTRGTSTKVSAARPLGSAGAFGQSLTMYARVKRDGTRLVSADDNAGLNSQLSLVRVAPGSTPGRPIEEAAMDTEVDLAYLLQTMVDAGKKSTRSSVRFPDGTLAELTMSSKALGEGTLSSLSTNEGGENADDGLGAEIGKMRQALRDRSQRIDKLAGRANELDGAVADAEAKGGGAPTAEARALAERVRELEALKKSAEKERADAQRKVDAHVTHAAKIKATYNQLAGWYNNLRQEYAELQAKAKSGDGANSAELNEMSGTDKMIVEELEKVKEERDALQSALDKEKEDKDKTENRHSAVVATKAKALEDLRAQWENANSSIDAAKDEARIQARASETAQQELEDTRAELAKAKQAMEEAVANSKLEMDQLEMKRRKETSELREQMEAEGGTRAAEEVKSLQQKHSDEIAALAQKSTAKDEELRAAKTNLEEVTSVSQQISEELDVLKKEKLEWERSLKEQLEKDRAEMETSNKSALDAVSEEKDKLIASLKEEHEREIKAIKAEKDEVTERELVFTKTKDSELSGIQEENARLKTELEKITALEKDLTELRDGMSTLEGEKQKLETEKDALLSEKSTVETSSRGLLATKEASAAENGELKKKVETLEQQLKSKTEETEKSIRLLEDFEAENDEHRVLITRLRKERDDARTELKNTAEEKATQVSTLAREQKTLQEKITDLETSHNGEIDHVKEERDASIRELFKVRKTLNSELKQIKKDREELLSEIETAKTAQSDLTVELTQRDEKIAAVQSELDVAKEQAQSAEKQIGERELSLTTDRDAAQAKSAEKIMELQTELSAMSKDLEAAQLEAKKVEELGKVKEERDALQTALDKEKEDKDESENRHSAVLATKSKALDDLRSQLEAASSDASTAKDKATTQQQSAETVKQELEDARAELAKAKQATEDAVADWKREIEQLEAKQLKETAALREKLESDSGVELKSVQSKHADELAVFTQQSAFKDDELRDAKAKLEEVTSQCKQMSEEMDDLKKENEKEERLLKEKIERDRTEMESVNKNALDSLTEEKDSLIASLKSDHERELRAIQAEKDAVTERELAMTKTKSSELSGIQEENIRLGSELAKTKSLEKDLREKMSALEGEKQKMESEKAALVREKTTAESASLDLLAGKEASDVENCELKTKVESLQKQIKAESEETSKSNTRLESEVEKSKALEKDVTDLREKMTTLEGEKQKLESEKSALVSEKSTVESSSRDLAASKDASAAENKELKQKLESLEKEIKTKDAEKEKSTLLLAGFETEKGEQSVLITQLTKERDDARTELKSAAEKEATQVSKLTGEQKTLEEKIASLESSHKGEIEKLKKERDASIGELSSLRKGLNGDLEQIKKNCDELTKQLKERDETIVSMRSDLKAAKEQAESAQNQVSERSVAAAAASAGSLEKVQADLKHKEEEFAKLTSLLEEMTEEAKESDAEFDQMQGDFEAMKEELETIMAEKQRAIEQNQRLEDELVEVQDRMATAEGISRGSQRKIRKSGQAAQAELLHVRAKAEKFEAQLAKLKMENRALSVRVDTSKSAKDASQDQLVNDLITARIGLAESHEENARLRNELKRSQPGEEGGRGSGSFDRKKPGKV